MRSAAPSTDQPAAIPSLQPKPTAPTPGLASEPSPAPLSSLLPAAIPKLAHGSVGLGSEPTRKRPATGTASVAIPKVAAASSKASSQDKRQQTAKAYLGKLQEALPAAAYQQLMKCLQQYRKDHDTLRVTDGVLDLLRAPSRRHLLLDFATFLRTQDRDWFLRCVK